MNPNFDHVVILADESANWNIGGVRQLDRLVLALDQLATSISSQRKIDIFIFWRPDISVAQRWKPDDARIARCNFVDGLVVGGRERVFNTRLLVKPRGLERFVYDAVPLENDATIGDERAVWEKLRQRFEAACDAVDPEKHKSWQYIGDESALASAQTWLLRGSGKSQDGLVSRFLNRPISRLLTRVLLRFPITPNAWTMSIFPLLLVAFLFLLRGDYRGFVIGCAVFQLYSILDGCDGEIARAKNLVSQFGSELDTLCDTVGNLLLVIGVGFGLRTQHPASGWIYACEGIFCAALVVINEVWLHWAKGEEQPPSHGVQAAFYPRHRTLAQHSGLMFLGEKNVWWLVQLTKRDVAILFFLVLAVAGFPQWILHLTLLVTAITLLLSVIAMRSRRAGSETISGSRA
jgi:phosphatidylglycerophosphate synthase